jgi:hypothetical protein
VHDQVKAAYWAGLDDATDPADAEQRLRELVAELERPYPSAAACLTADLPALCIHLNYFPRLRKRFRSSNLLELLAGARGPGLSDLEYKQAGSMKIAHARREQTVDRVA